MEISELLIRIVFLLFPGLVASRLYRKLRGSTNKKNWEDLVEILIFATAAYLAWEILNPVTASISGWPAIEANENSSDSRRPSVFQAFLNPDVAFAWGDVAAATVIATALALGGAAAHTYKLLTHGAQFIRVSNRTGDEDIWDYFHNLPGSAWVFVRDHRTDLVYFGWIAAFSDSEKPRELVLGDVDVYRNAEPGELLYNVSVMYLSRPAEELTIEVPQASATQPT